MPQFLFAWLKTQEYQVAGARQMFSLTMAAIGSCFAKDGKKIADEVMRSLSGPSMNAEEWMDSLSQDQQMVLLGSKKKPKQE